MFDFIIEQNNRFHEMINLYEDKRTAAKVSGLVIKFLIPNLLAKLFEFNIKGKFFIVIIGEAKWFFFQNRFNWVNLISVWWPRSVRTPNFRFSKTAHSIKVVPIFVR